MNSTLGSVVPLAIFVRSSCFYHILGVLVCGKSLTIWFRLYPPQAQLGPTLHYLTQKHNNYTIHLVKALSVPEYSRMHAECSRRHAEYSRMHAESSRMHAECSRMHAECSRMFQNACRSMSLHAGP